MYWLARLHGYLCMYAQYIKLCMHLCITCCLLNTINILDISEWQGGGNEHLSVNIVLEL